MNILLDIDSTDKISVRDAYMIIKQLYETHYPAGVTDKSLIIDATNMPQIVKNICLFL
jgi:hypothetical protein